MKKANYGVLVGLFISGVLATSGWASGEGGTTAVQFLTMGAGARALAMGEASTASANDATALYWNPGALLRTEGHFANFMHAPTLEYTSFDMGFQGRGNGQ